MARRRPFVERAAVGAVVAGGALSAAKLGWDRLLVGANAKGIHTDDLPQAQKLVLPEWSHLSRKCARVFTDAYVRRLVELG